MSVAGRPQPAHVRERIRRGVTRWHALRRAALRVVPSDLARLRRGDVSPVLAPFLHEAHVESQALHDALGGAGNVSAQRAAIVADVVRVGVALRGELARYLRTQDPEAAGRVGSLATVRRAALMAVGLDEVRVERDLSAYLAAARASADAAQDRAGDEIASEPDPDDVGAGDLATCEDGPA